MSKPKIIAIIGPTASGKTGLAVELAREYTGEIVSADSRQVYKGMDIGTGKDLAEYESGGRPVRYHLIDVVEPTGEFDVASYQAMAYEAIDGILERGRLPFVAGGSGLYLQAVVDGYTLPQAGPKREKRAERANRPASELFRELESLKPDFANSLNNSDRNNPRRLVRYLEIAEEQSGLSGAQAASAEPRYSALVLGLAPEEDELEKKIYSRLMERLERENMVGEVEMLNSQGVSWQRLKKFGLEYKWIALYLEGSIGYGEMAERLYRDIRKFAKRQLTWFRRWERQGRVIHWISSREEARNLIREFIEE